MRARAASASWIVSADNKMSCGKKARWQEREERTQGLKSTFALALHLALSFILSHVLTRHECQALNAVRGWPTARDMSRVLQCGRGKER